MQRFKQIKTYKNVTRIYNSCRLCGMDNAEKVKIFEDVVDVDEDDPPLNKKIEACLGLEVSSLPGPVLDPPACLATSCVFICTHSPS